MAKQPTTTPHVYTKRELARYRSRREIRWFDGIPYHGYSVERKDMGGYVSKKEAIAELKRVGARYTFRDDYTPYVGHWGIHVEAAFEDFASELFFGK